MDWRGVIAKRKVFPTCVGVNQYIVDAESYPESLPHVRGGEPR